ETALVVGVEKMTARSTAEVTQALASAGYQNNDKESALSFPQVFGVAASQYAERYQDPLEAMAKIAVKNHGNALSNPLAHMHRALDFDMCNTVSDKNPLIAHSIRLSDCSLISDGAAALVLTTAEHATSFPHAVAIRGKAQVNDFLPFSDRDLLDFEGPNKAINMALSKASITLEDLNFAEVHD